MKSIKTFAMVTALAVLSASAFTSCRKHQKDEDNDTSEAQDHSLAETTSNDVISMSSEVSETGNTVSYRGGINNSVFGLSCASVYRDTTRRVDSVVFNGSSCLDGKTRTGALTFTYASSTARHYRDPGFSCTVKSYNYVVNGNQVNIISKNITNTTTAGFNPATTNLTWSITGNISIVKASGGTHTFSYTRNKTLLNTSDPAVYHGAATAISWNLAKVGITGSASGVTASGRSYTANVTSMLQRDMTCSPDANHPGRHPFIAGSLDFTPSGKATRTINYGGGTCDLDATVTINGKSHAITLP